MDILNSYTSCAQHGEPGLHKEDHGSSQHKHEILEVGAARFIPLLELLGHTLNQSVGLGRVGQLGEATFVDTAAHDIVSFLSAVWIPFELDMWI